MEVRGGVPRGGPGAGRLGGPALRDGAVAGAGRRGVRRAGLKDEGYGSGRIIRTFQIRIRSKFFGILNIF